MHVRTCTKMKLSAVGIAIILFIVTINDAALANNNIDHESSGKNHTPEEHTILLECQHSDYRTYIKCLKRHKRHHEHHDSSGGSRSCFDECGLDLCTSTQCVNQCHTKCMKKTKETRQLITTYETVCNDNDCSSTGESHSSRAPNITTNIDINNIIHNHVNTTGPEGPIRPAVVTGGGDGVPGTPGNPGTSGCSGTPGCVPGTPVGPGVPAVHGGGCQGGYGYGCFPPISVVSTVTFGVGLGPIGGCINSQTWPCIQQTQVIN
uniref:COL2A1_0 protein n=1 Tax=Fopius arisanus TaxID=64838 RepID=A0A0C9RN91_9HYME